MSGAFDGLPLHDSHVRDPLEGAQDQDSLHLHDLHELGLLSNGTSDDYPPHRMLTQQQQQQQQQGFSCKTTAAHLDGGHNPNSNCNCNCNVQQQQQQLQQLDGSQLKAQHESSTATFVHHTDDRGKKGNTAGRNTAHHDAAMDLFELPQPAPSCSFLQAAVKTHQQQADLRAVPDRSTQQVAVEREKRDSSHGRLNRQLHQPAMHKGVATIPYENLLKAAGGHSSLYMQMHDAHLHITHCSWHASSTLPASICMLHKPSSAKSCSY